jgi:hypothetical protein
MQQTEVEGIAERSLCKWFDNHFSCVYAAMLCSVRLNTEHISLSKLDNEKLAISSIYSLSADALPK